ncbi:MAG TPA: alpha/beta fold hydrolase [Solirubrobacterales bacterium]|nr:alpha/beta fold hydrolase [Solirubrobacterales bacterium]
MERETFRVPTPDGRWLAAEMAGPEDGSLLVFHVGTPGTAYLFEGMVGDCVERGLRMVTMSRPGYDGSPRRPGRSYADNPVDTAALLDFLGVESAYVVGHSGGGGPALADAALLPDRVSAAAAMATLAPREAMGPEWWEGLDTNRDEFSALEAGEDRLRQELEKMVEGMAAVEDIASEGDFGEFYSPADRACLKGELLDFDWECRRRIRSGVEGWIDDDFALYGNWGFSLDSIRVPVSVWQGGQDRIIPVAHTRWLADRVPGAEYNLRPDEGHVSLMTRCFGAVLDDLLAR